MTPTPSPASAPAPPAHPTRLARMGTVVGRHPWRVLGLWLVVVVLCFAAAAGALGGDSLFQRLTSGEPTVPGEARTGRDLISEAATKGPATMLQVTGVDLTAPAVATTVRRHSEALRHISGVQQVANPFLVPGGPTSAPARPLVAQGDPSRGGFLTVVDTKPGLAKAAQRSTESAVTAELQAMVRDLPGARGHVGGTSQLVSQITTQVETDLRTGEGIALPVSLLVMVVVFGGFIAAGMPVVGAIASIGGALASLLGFSYLIDLDASVVNVVTVLGLGLCIDYGLLVVSRFREELRAIAAGGPAADITREEVVLATSRTLASAGRTVMFSGLTVAISLSSLLVFSAQLMKAIGAAGVSVVVVALLVALTLVPALCALAGRRLLRRGTEQASDTGVFSALATWVQRRPVGVIVVVVAAMLVAAAPAFSLQLTSSGTRLLPAGTDQRVFFETLARDYPTTSAPDVTVVARAPLAEVTRWAGDTAAHVPGVRSVDAPKQATPELVSVGLRTTDGPLGDTTRQVVTSLRADRPAFPTWVTGQAAQLADFSASMRARAPLAVALVVVATFVLLFLMTGSVVVPVKALLLNVLSLGASLGITVWIFQEGHLEGLIGFQSVGGIESTIPLLVLAFGFGLSMDYEVFLLSRITELVRRGYDSDEAVVLGLQRSGRIITSAAVLIIIVFCGFAAGKLLVIKETGVALAVAVAIDATLVRMLLVPATMTVLGRRNWWAPEPLRRWHARHGISEEVEGAR
ncbi:MMPL family transporter [Oryzihumus sp.]|uniref:MMPL family transporter n=1 Tax=Oryzihumus sp. TaxID=1968903 RepID=UPI002EDAEF0B